MSDFQPIDRTGSFRGKIIEYKMIKSAKGSSVTMMVRALITGIWDAQSQTWDDTWEQYQCVADGMICVVKNDGTLNEIGARGLIEAAGWDGSAASATELRWVPRPVSFTVEEHEYQGNQSKRIGFINDYDSTPGSGGMSQSEAQIFDLTYGNEFRAIAANAARNSQMPNPAEAAKPPMGRKASPAPAPQVPGPTPPSVDLPF